MNMNDGTLFILSLFFFVNTKKLPNLAIFSLLGSFFVANARCDNCRALDNTSRRARLRDVRDYPLEALH